MWNLLKFLARGPSFPFMQNRLNLLPFAIQLSLFCLVSLDNSFVTRLAAISHFDSVLVGSFWQGFFFIHIIAIFFSGIKVPSTDWSFFVSL